MQAQFGYLEIRVLELKRKEGRSRISCSIMAASTRSQVISLYKMMLKESSRFPSYNYRTYALRRVRDAFRANREVEDPKAVERLMDEGEQMLALIQRQVSIGKMYEAQRTVVDAP